MKIEDIKSSVLLKLINVIALFTIVSLSSLLFFVFITSGYCLAMEDGSRVAKDCNALSTQEIKEITTKLNAPNAKILNVAESPIKGICEVVFDNMGRIGIFYLGVDKKYMISGPVWETASMSNITQETLRKMKDKKKVDISQIRLDDTLALGESGASKKVIVFTDPDCPFSSQLHQTMKQIVAKRKDIVFYIKFYPLVSIHKDAYWKAKSILCNRSIKMLEDNFEKKEIPKTECTSDDLENSIKLATTLGISGTPALILPDGRIRDGAMPEAELTDLVDGKK